MLRKIGRAPARGILGEARAIAALEFAMVAPILLSLVLFAVDGARAFLIWRQIHNAANAIAENAEKLSVTTDPVTGLVTSELTYDQMQQAMTTIFAEIPGLNLGNGGGLFPGNFAVSLSSVWFYPLCQSANLSGCAPQTPFLRWSTYLNAGYVGAGPRVLANVVRQCTGLPFTAVPAFPDNNGQYGVMVSPTLASGGTTQLTAPPTIVVDVQYQFTPYFLFFIKPTVFYASATSPAPVGGLDQTTEINTNAPTGNVANCVY